MCQKGTIQMMKTWHLLIETQVGDLNFLIWTFLFYFYPLYFLLISFKIVEINKPNKWDSWRSYKIGLFDEINWLDGIKLA